MQHDENRLVFQDGQFTDDVWVDLPDDGPIPVEGPAIVTLVRLAGDDGEYFLHGGCRIGVRLRPEDRLGDLVPWMARLELIALNFEKFTDGRPYSAARLLRERMGYRGRLRATGEVLVDQYAAMRRCGFDSFVVAKGRALRSWQAARIEMSVRYQAPQESVLERRHARRAVLEVA